MTKQFRVLVCGGRDYGWKFENGRQVPDIEQRVKLFSVLDDLLSIHSNLCIIHGAAKGADSLAGTWAASKKVEVDVYPAQWDTYGKSAGYVRNTQMLEEGEPELVLAFSGGNGTAMMVSLAKKVGVKVVSY